MADTATQLNEAKQEDQTPMRRVKVYLINPIDVMMLFTKGLLFAKRTKIIKGVPDDAELVGITYDARLDFIMMVVKSMEFEPVPINQYPPMETIEIEIGVDGATKKKKK